MAGNKILIVEDENIVALHIKSILRHLKYEVVGVLHSGEEAVEFVEKSMPDLILMDIHLAGDIDGIEAVESITQKHAAPVVYLTAYADDNTLSRAKKTGPLGYLVKPFEEKELQASVEMAFYKYQHELELKESEERYRALFDSALDQVYMHDFSGNFLDANNIALSLLGYSKDEIKGMNISQIVCRDQLPFITHLIEEIKLKNVQKDVSQLKFLSKSGEKVYVESSSSIIYKNKKPFAIQMVARDITQRKHAEEELAKSEFRFRMLVDKMNDGLMQCDLNDVIEFVNPRLCELVGYSEEELLGKCAHQVLLFEEDWDLLKAKTAERIKKISDRYELRIKRKDGSVRWMGISGSPILDGDGNVIGSIGLHTDITEKKKADEAMAHLAAIVESSQDAIISETLDGFIISWNRGAEIMYGYSAAEVIGKHFSVLSPAQRKDEAGNILLRLESDKKITELESFHLHKSGRTVEVSMNISYIKNAKGTVTGASVIAHDITEHKKAQRAAAEQEQSYRSLVEASIDAIYVLQKDKLVMVNPAWEKLFGISAGNACAEDFDIMQIIAPESKEMISDRFEKYLNHKSVFPKSSRYEMVGLSSEGNKIYIEVSTSEIIWKGKTAVQGIYRDITDRKLAEEQIRTLSRAIQQSPASVLILDTTGRIEYVNPKFTHYTSYTPDDVLGKKPYLLDSNVLSPEEKEELWENLKSGKEWKGEFQNKLKNGRMSWSSASIMPIMNEEGSTIHLLLTEQDITDRKNQERQLIIAKENAEKSDRLKTEFLAQMSHEIRTPLNNILTYISVLKEEFEDKLPSGLESAFSVIDNSAQRLIRTIELILNLSRIQTGNYETNYKNIDLDKDVLEDLVLEFYSRARDRNLYLNYEKKNNFSNVIGDQYSLGQIFVNLIDNAIKYTPSGGIKIIMYQDPDQKICVDISDTGIGVSEEYLPELFNPFSQEDSSMTRHFEGTGLGLALVKKYVELNHAEIKVTSKKDEGTTFTLLFQPAGMK